MNLYRSCYIFVKKVFYIFRAYRKEFIINRNTYPLLTFTHAECTCKLYLIGKIIFVNKVLKLFNYLT